MRLLLWRAVGGDVYVAAMADGDRAEGDSRRVEARSAVRLGFHRHEQFDFRLELQGACAGLVAGEGELLHAVYAHPLIVDDSVDAENVLTYNVGMGRLAAAITSSL